jgi:hypothetical protein
MSDLTWYQKILTHPRLQRVIANRYGRAAIALGISCLAHVPCVLMLTGTLALSGAAGALLMHPLAIMSSSFALLVGGHLASKALCNRYCEWASCLLAGTRPEIVPVQSLAEAIIIAKRAREWNFLKNTGLTVAALGIAGAQGFFIAPMLHRHPEAHRPPPASVAKDAGVRGRVLLSSPSDLQNTLVLTTNPVNNEVQVYHGKFLKMQRVDACGAMIWDGLFNPIDPTAPTIPAHFAKPLLESWGGIEKILAQIEGDRSISQEKRVAYQRKITLLLAGNDETVFVENPPVSLNRAAHHRGGH